MSEETPSAARLGELGEQEDEISSHLYEIIAQYRSGIGELSEQELTELGEKRDDLSNQLESLKAEIEKFQVLAAIEATVNQFKSFLPVAKYAIDSFKGEVAEILTNLVSALIDVREGLDEPLARLSKLNAHDLYRKFTDHQEAGFSKEQAFTLVLAGIKPVNFSEVVSKSATSGVEAAARKR